MGKQKKLNKKKGVYKGVEGLSEFEAELLPNPQQGPKALDPGFETIWHYENLVPLIKQARIDFNNDLAQKVKKSEIKKINSGLTDYVSSSTKFSYNLALLKASILNAFDKEIVTKLYNESAEDVKQMFPPSYFENITALTSINHSWLIKPKSIKEYQKLAILYTCRVLEEYISNSDILEDDISDLLLYRGQGNVQYYKNDLENNRADIISVLAGLDNGSFPYFERQLLNSYSINSRLAETFMVHNNNQRRSLIRASFTSILPNIFSSFIVSDIFASDQYEILSIANKNNLYVKETANDPISAEYHLSETEDSLESLNRLYEEDFD
jgi:hypothetical protein